MDFFSEMTANQISYTENGAKGLATTGHALLDLNFRIPSFRNSDLPYDLFDISYEQDPIHTMKWLLYLRDIKQGCGERQSFRKFLSHLCEAHPAIVVEFIYKFVANDYGRWDDVLDVYFSTNNVEVRTNIKRLLVNQLHRDMDSAYPSLLAKWLPSESSKNKTTRYRARHLATEVFGLSSRSYRKILSTLRKYVASTEVLTSAGKWGDVLYQNVPSKANIKYRNAFRKHDPVRRANYLADVRDMKSSIHANAMFLHDIIRAYFNEYGALKVVDDTLEALWSSQDKVTGFKDTLIVRDGSASMKWGYNEPCPMNVANALTLYCSENNKGIYHNKFITFSDNPACVTIPKKYSLHDKLQMLAKYDECANSTNVESVFDLVLNTAIKSKAKAKDLPKNILIVSDMEFNCAVNTLLHETLFETIANKYKAHGYALPKLIFWNVGSRTNTIPMQQNENGVILLSGFSKNLLQMVMSSEFDPYKALIKTLDTTRYECIDEINFSHPTD